MGASPQTPGYFEPEDAVVLPSVLAGRAACSGGLNSLLLGLLTL